MGSGYHPERWLIANFRVSVQARTKSFAHFVVTHPQNRGLSWGIRGGRRRFIIWQEGIQGCGWRLGMPGRSRAKAHGQTE